MEEGDSKSENQVKSSLVISDSSPRSVNFSSGSGSAWLEKIAGLGEGGVAGAEVGVGVAAAVVGGLVVLWWFLEAGHGWLCSQEYVTTSMVGSTRLLSTCFLAGQPFELLHL